MSDDARQRWVAPDLAPRIEAAHQSATPAATSPEIERI
jgi:hypothetical protein